MPPHSTAVPCVIRQLCGSLWIYYIGYGDKSQLTKIDKKTEKDRPTFVRRSLGYTRIENGDAKKPLSLYRLWAEAFRNPISTRAAAGAVSISVSPSMAAV